METSKGVTQADKNALDHLWDGLSMMNNPEHPAWAALTHVKDRLAHTVDATGERERTAILQNKRVNDAIQTALNRADKS